MGGGLGAPVLTVEDTHKGGFEEGLKLEGKGLRNERDLRRNLSGLRDL